MVPSAAADPDRRETWCREQGETFGLDRNNWLRLIRIRHFWLEESQRGFDEDRRDPRFLYVHWQPTQIKSLSLPTSTGSFSLPSVSVDHSSGAHGRHLPSFLCRLHSSWHEVVLMETRFRVFPPQMPECGVQPFPVSTP